MGYVYLIESIPDEGQVMFKIGFTKNEPIKRLKQLQTGCGYKLKLVSSYESRYYKDIENILHNQYKHYKVNNEWFYLPIKNVVNFNDECVVIEKNLILFNKQDIQD